MKRSDRQRLFSGSRHIERKLHQSIRFMPTGCSLSTRIAPRWIQICQVLVGLGIAVVLSLASWLYLLNIHISTIRWYSHDYSYNNGDNTSCSGRHTSTLNSDELGQTRHLLVSALRALQEQGVRAALCHGSLWGVLRTRDLLPCDPVADLCVLDSELYQGAAATKEAREGKIFNLSLRNHSLLSVSKYDYWMGLYRLKFSMGANNNTKDMRLNLRVFSDCTRFYYWTHWRQYMNDYPDYLPQPEPDRPRWACPAGLSFYVFHWTRDGYRGFPKMLLEPPFRNLTLGEFHVSVPHDDFEIQKYIYPNDWWVEKSPPCCHPQH